ncbi:MAG: NPCBM/NEW2 domain-containing protein [Pseudolysinimonas sp.]
MSDTRMARPLLGLAAALAVLASALAPASPPAAHAAASAPAAQAADPQFTPDAFVEGQGTIPCLDASQAEFRALECRARKLIEFEVPSELVTPLIASGRDNNCIPDAVSPSSKTSTVQAGVSVTATHTTTSSTNGATWTANGTTVTVGPSFKGTSLGSVSYHYMKTDVEGWSKDVADALGTTYSWTDSRTVPISPYHWSFWTFTPKYKHIEVLWTWSEPSISAQRLGVRASGVQTFEVPMFRSGVPPVDTDHDGKVTVSEDVVLGDWNDVQTAMTPAEVAACRTGSLKDPTFHQPSLVAPSGTSLLDSMPFLYTKAPPTAPVLRDRAGTGGLLQDARLVVANSLTDGPVYDTEQPVEHSVQLMGGSEAGFWLGGNCTALTARIGYGTNMLVARDGVARDTVQVWAGTLEHGLVKKDRLLSSTLVPAAPDRPSASGRDLFQTTISADVSKAEIVIIEVVTGDGERDALSIRAPGVLLAEPRLTCASGGSRSDFQQSVYVDKVTENVINLAGTPEQVTSDPDHYMQPSEVNYGWGGCANDPKNEAGVMPRTKVNRSCGDLPLTVQGKVYDSGIGFHSGEVLNNSGQAQIASVVWATTPEYCTKLTFGVGYDDNPGFPRSPAIVKVYSQLHDPRDGSLGTWALPKEQIGSSLNLSGDGSSGVQWFDFESLGVGAHRIEIQVSVDFNARGHVDIVKPTLTCLSQGPTTSTVPTVKPQGESVGVHQISAQTWDRESNFWGPVERDSSLGENARGDGRPIDSADHGPVMTIGGVSGWASGLGMAPGSGRQEAQIDLTAAGRCQRVTAWVGIDDEVGSNGSATFKVYADGKVVAESPLKRGGQLPSFFSADVTGAMVVTLAVNNAGDNSFDHADWGEPTLYCATPPDRANVIRVAKDNVPWQSEYNGWGPAERNMSLGEDAARDGRPMSIAGYTGWTTGIGAAPGISEDGVISIPVSGNCTAFTAWVGVDDETEGRGSVVFRVLVDGVYRDGVENHVSFVKRGGDDPEFMRVNITGARSIQLAVNMADTSNAWDHADWANPTVYCG